MQNSIDKLNTNKSSDEYGINAEHLKNSKKSISSFLTKTFNKILEIRKAPTSFKTGVLTPVLKKGKDTTLCASYRGITVTSIIGKTFEYSMLRKLKLTNMTDLQFGFTEGLNPIMVSLLISESKCEKKKNSKGIIDQSIHPTLWLIIKDLYSGLTSKVKWAGELSESFDNLEGVRQGGILSTHLYKIFVQDLLLELESQCLGFQLGDIYIGTPTCTDDIALIESSKDNLQIMINVIGRYAKQHHYRIHPMKTKIIQYSTTNDEYKWYLDDNEITTKEDAIHLGIIRSEKNECSKNIEARLESARRTKYALMGSGFHGTNGIDAVTSYRIYHTYVLPRLIYKLEVLPLKKKHVENLESFHTKSIRYLQSLPQRIATADIYLLVGAIPIETELHKRKLSLLYSMLASDNSKIKEIINRQINVSYDNEDSLFCNIRDILILYDLPSITDLQAKLPLNISWKKLVRKEVETFWLKRLQNDATAKTTLKYLAVNHLKIGTSYPL